MAAFNKFYLRFQIWRNNKERIKEHNKLADMGKESYWMKTDWSSDLVKFFDDKVIVIYRFSLIID